MAIELLSESRTFRRHNYLLILMSDMLNATKKHKITQRKVLLFEIFHFYKCGILFLKINRHTLRKTSGVKRHEKALEKNFSSNIQL